MDLAVMSGEFVRQRKALTQLFPLEAKVAGIHTAIEFSASTTKGNNCLEHSPFRWML